MTRKEVNSQSPKAKLFAQITAEEIQKLALEEAAKRNFDVAKAPHGTFRAMMHVLTNKDLMAVAAKRSRERLERTPLWAATDVPKRT